MPTTGLMIHCRSHERSSCHMDEGLYCECRFNSPIVEFRNQQEVLVFERYSILSRQAVMAARVEAGKLGSDAIDSEHLLMGVVCVHPDLFTSLGIEVELDSLREKCREFRPPSSPIPNSRDLPLSEDASRILQQASALADERQIREVRTEHLLLSMIEAPCHGARLLAKHGPVREKLLTVVSNVVGRPPQTGTPASDAALKVALNIPRQN
jgi:ATP-dependent Clp protease ATP-binding subunit ClpA